MIDLGDIPVLPRGVRRHQDTVRGVQVLLGPERVLMLDEVGCAVLDRVDGTTCVFDIAQALARAFEADKTEVLKDVQYYLGDLAAKQFLDLSND